MGVIIEIRYDGNRMSPRDCKVGCLCKLEAVPE